MYFCKQNQKEDETYSCYNSFGINGLRSIRAGWKSLFLSAAGSQSGANVGDGRCGAQYGGFVVDTDGASRRQ